MPQHDQIKKIIPRPDPISIFQSQKVLGTGENLDLRNIFTCYETKIWAMNENNEWTKEHFELYTLNKNILVRAAICHQIETESDGRFKIKENVPFENPCRKCNGGGELYQFDRKPIEVTCMKCKGTGKNKDGKCMTCCAGKSKTKTPGIIRTFGIIPQFRKVTICPACKGQGYFPPVKKENPLMDSDLANKLKSQIVQNTPSTDIGKEIHAAPSEPDDKEKMIDPSQPTSIQS